MGGKHDRGPAGDLVELLDEHRALGLEAPDHVEVVDDLAAHVDRRAEPLEGPLDDLDRPLDPGAERARRRQDHLVAGRPPPPSARAAAAPGAGTRRPGGRPGPCRASRCRPPTGRRPAGGRPGARPTRPTPCRPRVHRSRPARQRRPPRTRLGEDTTGPVTTSRPGRRNSVARRSAAGSLRTTVPSVSRSSVATTSCPGARSGSRPPPTPTMATAAPSARERGQRGPLGLGPRPPSPAHLDLAAHRQRLDPQRGHHDQAQPWPVACQVTAQRREGEHQPVEVVVDVEVPREARPGEPRLVPVAVGPLGVERGRPPPGRWRRPDRCRRRRPGEPAGPRRSARRWRAPARETGVGVGAQVLAPAAVVVLVRGQPVDCRGHRRVARVETRRHQRRHRRPGAVDVVGPPTPEPRSVGLLGGEQPRDAPVEGLAPARRPRPASRPRGR